MRFVIQAALMLLMVLSSAATARGRLGESEAAIIQRLGKPSVRQHFDSCDKDTFSVNGFMITVTILNGCSAGELYRITKGTLSVTQIVELLNANNQGYSWYEVAQEKIPKGGLNPIKKMWERQNGSTAVSNAISIEFKSIDLILAEANASKPSAPTTAGF